MNTILLWTLATYGFACALWQLLDWLLRDDIKNDDTNQSYY